MIFQVVLIFSTTLVILFSSMVYCQEHAHHDERDTHYMVIENKVKSKFWGNAWHVPLSYTIGLSHDFEVGIGRSYKRSFCGGAGCSFHVNSWGISYGYSKKSTEFTQSARLYYGYNLFYFPPFSYGFRGDYIYDFLNNIHYLKPSLGFSTIVADLFYSYGLQINSGNRILPSHGFTLRINLLYPLKKWEDHHPNKC